MKRRILLYRYTFGLLFIFFVITAMEWKIPAPNLKNGFYRFELQRQDSAKIVFISEVKFQSGKQVMYIINGQDRLLADDIETSGDSVFIRLPFFESSLRAKLNDNQNLTGVWVREYGSRKQSLPFTATFNAHERFAVASPPTHNISGRWAVTFTGRNNRLTHAVGEFDQQGARLTGTFRTSTGDYRFLEGVVSGDSLYLSGFDGGGARLFAAVIKSDKKITAGKYYSGGYSKQSWSAEKDKTAKLPDEYSLTKIKPNAGKLNFSFPDVNGKTVSISDSRFKNKVVVVQILGSWCPNCMDEARFISENYSVYRQKGVEFIGLAYEASPDFSESQKALQPFIKRFNIQYPVLITGVSVSDTLRTEKTLPQLEKIKAFPTTLFVDKKGIIRKIHTGFDGPATGVHYMDYKKEFDEIINDLSEEE